MTKEEIQAKQDELLSITNLDEQIEYACEEFSEGRLPAKILRWLYSISDIQTKLRLVNNIYAKDNKAQSSNMHRCPPSQLIEDDVIKYNGIELAIALSKYKMIEEFVINKNEESKYKFRKLINDPNSFFRIKFQDKYVEKILRKEIQEKAMMGFFEEISNDTSILGIWGNTTIGVELEFAGLNQNQTYHFASVAKSKFPRIFDTLFKDSMFSFMGYLIKGDVSVHDVKNPQNGGTEIVSPIISDTEEDWKKLNTLCNFIKLLGGKTNQTCGGHIHIGINILGVDSKAWEELLKVWREIEPIMYLITNRRGEQVRKRANKYAAPESQKIDEILEKGTINLKSNKDILDLAGKFGTRYLAFNLQSLLWGDKETIEFRLANGSIDYEIIRENIRLYVAILQFAKTHSLLPSYKKSEYKSFFEADIPEEEKLERFLGLIFEDENVKEVYRKRWKHMAGTKENINFATRRYQKFEKPKTTKEQLKDIAVEEVGKKSVDSAMEVIIGATEHDRSRQEIDLT